MPEAIQTTGQTDAAFDPVRVLSERFRDAIAAAFPEHADADPLIARSRNPKFGDFQSNVAMGLAKQAGKNPRDVAQAIVERLDLEGVAEPLGPQAIAGPGFINITLKSEALAALLSRMDEPGLGLDAPAQGETVVVDLVGVNLSKQMHVGHLRSMIIGDAIARTLDRLGANVIRQNHVGDWGLPIAMVVRRIRIERDAGRLDLDHVSLTDLDRLYREAQAECSADRRGLAAAQRWWAHPKAVAELEAQVGGAEESLADAKRTLINLQAGDPETVAIWQRIADVTMGACLDACRRLDIDVDETASAGESSYRDELASLVADLEKRNVAEQSAGALVVRVEGVEEPCLVRKSDGGFLYATTDLAAIRRRVQKLGASRVIYAVDARQALHFRQVFGAAAKAGYTRVPDSDRAASLEHAAFGMVLGEDHRPFKTRSGENVRLSALIDEAIERAEGAVQERNPDLAPDERRRIAERVAVSAIKYADLSSDRSKDYVFSFERMLAFEGDTGPYLLYALVRIKSIFRKAAERIPEDEQACADAPLLLRAPEEKDLALALLRYPSTVRGVATALEPHRLTGYLYELASSFSAFFQNCPVLQAEDEAVRRSRLRLCHLTDRVLSDGLRMLGIEPLDRM